MILLKLFLILILYLLISSAIEKTSIFSKIISIILFINKKKNNLSTSKGFSRYILKNKIRNQNGYKLPKVKYKCNVIKNSYDNMDYYIFDGGDNKNIFYLPGGGYIENPLIFHMIFIDKIAYQSKSKIIVPIYPKTPIYNYHDCYSKLISLYKKLYMKENNEIIIMGDSAGGGLALGLSIKLKKYNIKLPNKNILISPWLDITLSNKEIINYEKKDPQLSKEPLIKIGKLWGNNEENNYLLSPIIGNLDYLNNIFLFIGTNEILYPDAMLLEERSRKQKVKMKVFKYDNMNHVFPLHPSKEGKKARSQIINIINL